MPIPDPFAGFSSVAHPERIEIAAQDLLLADSEISAYVGTRVFRVPDPVALPPIAPPAILLTCATETQSPDLQAENDVQVSLLIVVHYEERRATLAVGERSIKTFVHRLRYVLQRNNTDNLLVVPRFNHPTLGTEQPLVQRADDFRLVDYGDVERAQPSVDGEDAVPDITRYLAFAIDYTYAVYLPTQEPVDFTPPAGL